MTNREWLNSLSNEELARFILHDKCDSCSLESKTEGCHMKCAEGITEWLDKKRTEPMAEIKIGDLLTFAGKKTEYTGIVVDDDTVFLHAEEKRHYLKLLIKDCVNIRRYDCWKDEWETIWRADKNE